MGGSLGIVCCVRTSGGYELGTELSDREIDADARALPLTTKAKDMGKKIVEKGRVAGVKYGNIALEQEKKFENRCCYGKKKYYWLTGFSLWATITFLFLPREPSWDVQGLEFKDFTVPALRSRSLYAANTDDCPKEDPCGEALAKGCSQCPDPNMDNDGCLCRGLPADKLGFFGGIADFMKHMDEGSIITMTLESTVVAYNPNFIGASTLPGSFDLFYKTNLLGKAGVRPLTIPGGTSILGGEQGSANVSADVKVHGVTPVMGMEIVQELLENNYQMKLSVQGFVTAVAGPLQVKAHAECDLRADVSPYIHLTEQQEEMAREDGKFPPTKFSEKKCYYSYGL